MMSQFVSENWPVQRFSSADRNKKSLHGPIFRDKLAHHLNCTTAKYWEIIADNLSKAGWSWGWVSAVDCEGRTIWIADAHRGDGKRFVVHADEKFTAFIELESAIRACGELS